MENQLSGDEVFASDILLRLQETGKYFHGSPVSSLPLLSPRRATDADPSKEFNNDEALFATDQPAASVVFALVKGIAVPEQEWGKAWSVRLEDGQLSARIPHSWQNALSKQKGYVYAVNPETFTERSGGYQWKSKQAVNPEEVVEVTIEDYLRLGGLIEWEV